MGTIGVQADYAFTAAGTAVADDNATGTRLRRYFAWARIKSEDRKRDEQDRRPPTNRSSSHIRGNARSLGRRFPAPSRVARWGFESPPGCGGETRKGISGC